MKDREERLPWDKKKIALLLLFLLGTLLIFVTAKSIFLDQVPEDNESLEKVRGVQIEDPKAKVSTGGLETQRPSINLEEKVEDIKTQVESVQVSEIASSSPQIQKILNDIKSLKDYPSSTARQACENICKNL